MGIDLDELCKNRLRICPHIDDDLDSAELVLPLPCGIVRASFARRDGKIAYLIKAPSSLQISFDCNENIVFSREE